MKTTLTIAFLLGSAAVAVAQEPCGPDRQAMLDTLVGRFDETLHGNAVDGMGNLVELYTGPDDTWTLVISGPRGCVVFGGRDWGAEPLVPTGDPA